MGVPAKPVVAVPEDVLVAHQFDADVLARLDAGAKVLLLPARLSRQHPRLGFEPIFWNRYMFNTQNRQTLGLLCNPKDPALAEFPTESFQDCQWDEIVSRGRAMVLDALPGKLHPLVQVIDDWNTNRKLGLIWECRVGSGKLLVCGSDLEQDAAHRPAARQLLQSLLDYISSKAFAPQEQVSNEVLTELFRDPETSGLARLGAKVLETDSEDAANGNVAANAIDGDPETIWHTRWQPANAPMPHQITLDLGRELTLDALTYLPRQEMANGRIARAEIYCAKTLDAWGAPVATVSWPNSDQLQSVHFSSPVLARYLRIRVLSEVNGNPFASIAELGIVTSSE